LLPSAFQTALFQRLLEPRLECGHRNRPSSPNQFEHSDETLEEENQELQRLGLQSGMHKV
jgi:hypothetical protein